MHISNVNSSELRCRQNFNLCHAGGYFKLKKKKKRKKERKRKGKDKKEKRKTALKIPG